MHYSKNKIESVCKYRNISLHFNTQHGSNRLHDLRLFSRWWWEINAIAVCCCFTFSVRHHYRSCEVKMCKNPKKSKKLPDFVKLWFDFWLCSNFPKITKWRLPKWRELAWRDSNKKFYSATESANQNNDPKDLSNKSGIGLSTSIAYASGKQSSA